MNIDNNAPVAVKKEVKQFNKDCAITGFLILSSITLALVHGSKVPAPTEYIKIGIVNANGEVGNNNNNANINMHAMSVQITPISMVCSLSSRGMNLVEAYFPKKWPHMGKSDKYPIVLADK